MQYFVAASKPRQAMMATIFHSLDEYSLRLLSFIRLWGWGIRGAAFATVLSQALAYAGQMKQLTNKDEILHLKRGIYRLKRHLVENIISIGISPFLMNVCACIVVIFMNNQLVRYGGDMAVGAFGIAYSVAMIFVMFVIG